MRRRNTDKGIMGHGDVAGFVAVCMYEGLVDGVKYYDDLDAAKEDLADLVVGSEVEEAYIYEVYERPGAWSEWVETIDLKAAEQYTDEEED